MDSVTGATAGSAAAGEHVWIPSVCYMCYNACSIKAHRVNGVVVKIEGDPESPHNQGRMCAKGNSGLMSLYNPHRLWCTQGEWASGRPLARGKGVHFNTLIPYGLEYIDTLSGALDACVKVKIRKAG